MLLLAMLLLGSGAYLLRRRQLGVGGLTHSVEDWLLARRRGSAFGTGVHISICCGRTVTTVTVRPQTCSGLSYADVYDKSVLTLSHSQANAVDPLSARPVGWVGGVGISRAFS